MIERGLLATKFDDEQCVVDVSGSFVCCVFILLLCERVCLKSRIDRTVDFVWLLMLNTNLHSTFVSRLMAYV